MDEIPLPLASPSPPDPGPEEDSKAKRMRQKRMLPAPWWKPWIDRLKFTALAMLVGSAGGVVFKVWEKVDLVNQATAQTRERADRALEVAHEAKADVKLVDAGTALAIENLRREVSEARTETDKKLDKMLDKILAEVKKR